MRGRSGYQISVYILGFDCLRDLKRPKTDAMWGNMDSGIREIFECGIRIAGLWNLNAAQGVPESSHWIQNPQRGIQNPTLSWILLHGAIESCRVHLA